MENLVSFLGGSFAALLTFVLHSLDSITYTQNLIAGNLLDMHNQFASLRRPLRAHTLGSDFPIH